MLAAIETHPAQIELKKWGIIQVIGSDAATFLQGQLTCDVMSVQQPTLTACCERKGRMLAIAWIWKHENDYLLLLPQSVIAPLMLHLKKYILNSKVKLEIYNKPHRIFGITQSSINTKNNVTIINLNDRFQRQIIVFYSNEEDHVFNESKQLNQEPETPLWDLLNVRSGRAFIYSQTQYLFTPQMLNLQKLGAINFTKGCFIGQEIIARTEHLGQLKRHLYRAFIAAEAQPVSGDEVVNSQNESLGNIVESALSPEAGYEILAVLQDRAHEDPSSLNIRGFSLTHLKQVED